jgi:hypothetical protein
MRQSRPRSFENSQPATANALIALVRLLACQATRQFVTPAGGTSPQPKDPMTDGPDYLRAPATIARVTGVSIRTRRCIAKRICVSGKVGGARLWPRPSLSGHDY